MSFFGDKYLVELLKDFKTKFDYNTIVETGTHTGNSAIILNSLFGRVYTCENDPQYFNMWSDLQLCSNVKIYKKSSVDCLDEIFTEIGHDKFYLYLDAHGLDLYTRCPQSPLLKELEIVAKFNYKPIIMIHDFDPKIEGWNYDMVYNPKTNEMQPLDWNFLKESINNIYGEDNYSIDMNEHSEINRKLLTIIPK